MNEQENMEELTTLLQEYEDCFADNTKEIGEVKIMEMDIEVMYDKSVVAKPYRKPYRQDGGRIGRCRYCPAIAVKL